MKIYIEKGFIEQFEKDICDPSKIFQFRALSKTLDLFRTYAELEVYSDVSRENILNYLTLKRIGNYNSAFFDATSFENLISENNLGNQSLAFCLNENSWKQSYEKIGGLYFTANDYIEKIESILNIEKEIRLANYQGAFKWDVLDSCSKLPNNYLILIDAYVLSKPRIVKHNMAEILSIFSKNDSPIFTILSTSGKKENMQFSKKVIEILEEKISNNNLTLKTELITIYPKTIDNVHLHNYRIHDRYLFGNYFSVFAPSGFEILPIKKGEKNDTKIDIRSIFDKKHYDDFKEFIPIYQSYVKWVNMTERKAYQIPFV